MRKILKSILILSASVFPFIPFTSSCSCTDNKTNISDNKENNSKSNNKDEEQNNKNITNQNVEEDENKNNVTSEKNSLNDNEVDNKNTNAEKENDFSETDNQNQDDNNADSIENSEKSNDTSVITGNENKENAEDINSTDNQDQNSISNTNDQSLSEEENKSSSRVVENSSETTENKNINSSLEENNRTNNQNDDAEEKEVENKQEEVKPTTNQDNSDVENTNDHTNNENSDIAHNDSTNNLSNTNNENNSSLDNQTLPEESNVSNHEAANENTNNENNLDAEDSNETNKSTENESGEVSNNQNNEDNVENQPRENQTSNSTEENESSINKETEEETSSNSSSNQTNSEIEYRYNDSTPQYFKLNSNKEYLELIKKRSFSLTWTFDNGGFTAGTIWLLDYKEVEKNKKYKLFFGTNYHVAVDLISDNDYENVAQPNRTEKVTSIILGVANDVKNDSKFSYMNLENKNKPKLFWLARNFMDKKAYTEANREESHYADFGIIEWDFDLSQINTRNKEEFAVAKNIFASKEVLDNSIQKVKNNKIAMFDNQLPYATLDYGTIWELRQNIIGLNSDQTLNTESQKEKEVQINNYLKRFMDSGDSKNIYNYYYKPEALYVYGFPIVNHRNHVFKNILDQDLDKTTRSDSINGRIAFLPRKEYHEKRIADHGAIFNNEVKAPLFYGLAYYTTQRQDSSGGASGSLYLNQDGLPIGLHFGKEKGQEGYLNDNNEYEYNSKSLFIQLIQRHPVWTENGSVNTYNLLDGRDKNLYPLQVTSYKEQLEKIYGTSYTTALFNN